MKISRINKTYDEFISYLRIRKLYWLDVQVRSINDLNNINIFFSKISGLYLNNGLIKIVLDKVKKQEQVWLSFSTDGRIVHIEDLYCTDYIISSNEFIKICNKILYKNIEHLRLYI